MRSPSRLRVRWLALAVALAACSGPSEPVPAGLLFTTQLGAVVAGSSFLVTVAVVDHSGARIPGATNVVTLGLTANPGNATLSGSKTATAVDGVATFSLTLDHVGTGYSLGATTPGLTGTVSNPFSVGAAAPSILVFSTVPTNVISGTVISPAIIVTVRDAFGNVVTSAAPSISLSLGVNPGGATLTGTRVATASNGTAGFPDLRLDRAGNGYTLIASASNLQPAVSPPFNVRPGAPVRLAFSLQPPAETASDATFTTTVQLLDAAGNLSDSDATLVTVSLGANPGGAVLSGTTTGFPLSGTASFTLSLNNPGAGYTLTASAALLTGATSNPFNIRPTLNAGSVSAGYFHACALNLAGRAYCWGQNNGKLGDGTVTDRTAPVPVSGGLTFVSVSAGRNHSCGVTAAGAAYCWGENAVGELGDGTQLPRTAPTPVAGGLLFASVVAGYDHTCGLTVAGAAYCWGDNTAGALGDNSTTTGLLPVPVAGNLTFRSVSPGRLFSCGVTTGNRAYCWGDNVNGELGDGTNTRRTSPVLVQSALSFATVGAGGFHACGLTTGGQAHCWGANFSGQLGTGNNVFTNTPVPVLGGLVFTSMTTGNRHTCGTTAAGVAYCWGDNGDGALGDGTTTGRLLPAQVAGGLSFARISAGRFHSCGVTTGNFVYCWGNNFNGQVGAGPLQIIPAPLLVR